MDELLVDHNDGVLNLTLNRPDRRNALNRPLYEALLETLRKASHDASVGAIVLTGAGKGFCAGGDLMKMGAGEMSAEERVTDLRRRMQISELLHQMDKPTIAMIRGAAVGAGFSLALACDLRYADTTAKFCTQFINVAAPGDFGGHYFLQKVVGAAKARELYLLAPMLSADEALRLQLVSAVVAPEALASHVQSIARTLADGPRDATANMKRNINLAQHASLSDVLDAEAQRHVHCQGSPDQLEAIKAFSEKRPPRFGRHRQG